MDHTAPPVPYFEYIAVMQGSELKADVGSTAEIQSGVGRGCECSSSRIVIGMDVGVDDVTDHHRVALDVVDIVLGIALGIDDGAQPEARTSNDVGGTGAGFVEYLAEVHTLSPR
jgi:hypothetical protein